MLSSKYKINKNDIPYILKRGKRIHTDYFDIKLWYEDGLDNAKFAVIVSKKVAKSAVTRNRIRRKIKAAFIELVKSEELRVAKYVVIVRDAGLKDMSQEEIKKLLLKN